MKYSIFISINRRSREKSFRITAANKIITLNMLQNFKEKLVRGLKFFIL